MPSATKARLRPRLPWEARQQIRRQNAGTESRTGTRVETWIETRTASRTENQSGKQTERRTSTGRNTRAMPRSRHGARPGHFLLLSKRKLSRAWADLRRRGEYPVADWERGRDAALCA